VASGGGMKKLMGLGFLFGAKDNGATKTAGALSESFDSLKNAVHSVGEKTQGIQRFGNAINALNLLQLSRVKGTLEGIAAKAGSLGPRSGDTALESFGAQFNQTFKAGTAGLGEFRKEADRLRGQISGVAHTLQIDGGDILKTVTTVAKSGHQLEEFGLSVREVGGSIQANILSGEQLGNLLTSLSQGYNLGAKGAGNLVDKIAALGEMSGSGADALRQMPAAVAAADEIISDLGTGNIEDVTEAITRLANASVDRLGGDFNEAMADSIAVFQQLGGQKKQLRDLVTGLGSDFPKLAQEIGIASGDIDGALGMATSSPVEFAAAMNSLFNQMPENSMQSKRLLASLDGMPSGFKFLITGGKDAAAALKKAQKPLENFEGAFGRMAKGASGSTRTFGESMELESDRFKTALNSLGSDDSGGAIKGMRRAHNETIKFVKGLSESEGSVGKLTKAFLIFRRQGIFGLVNFVDKEFPEVKKAFNSLRTFWESFSGSVKKDGLGKALSGTLGPALGVLFDGMVDQASAALETTDWDRVGNSIGIGIDRIFASKNVEDASLRGMDKVVALMGDAMGRVASGIWEKAGWKSFIPLLFTGFGQTILRVGGGLIGKGIYGALKAGVMGIGSMVKGLFGKLSGGILGKAAGKIGGKALLTKIPVIGGILNVLFNLPKILEDFQAGNIQAGFLRLFGTVIDGVLLGIPGMIADLFGVDVVKDIVQPNLASFYEYFYEGMDIIVESAQSMWSSFADWGNNALGMVGEAVEGLGYLWDNLKESLVSGWKTVSGLIKGAVSGAFGFARNQFESMFEGFEGFFLMIQRGFQMLPVYVLGSIKSMLDNKLIGTLVEKFSGVSGVDVTGNIDRALKSAQNDVKATEDAQRDLERRGKSRERAYAAASAQTEDGGSAARARQDRQMDRETSRGKPKETGDMHIGSFGPKAARDLARAVEEGNKKVARSTRGRTGSAPGSAVDI
jgi:hypothetical protein